MILNRLNKLWLFIRIVWRRWDEVDGEVIRLDARTAWEIAGIVWPWEEVE